MIQPVFKILSIKHSGNNILAALAIDADSDIFKGHFPDQPVVPGACMLQTVKEILEDTFKGSLRMVKADNIKFLNMVTPDTLGLELKISYQLLEDTIKVTAELASELSVFMKLQVGFIKN
jgi:3-hydroxyacyl-[acyl-carrier-protein] dehydratase